MLVHLKPKIFFLIDGLGAFITALFLSTLLKIYYTYFRMPQNVLTVLAIIAIFYCIFSFICFLTLKNNWRPFLLALSIMNLFYCFLTFGLVLFHFHHLTNLGIAYFFGEILIIMVLAFFEYNKAKNLIDG